MAAIGVWIASVLFILIVPTIFLLPYLASLKPPITESDQIIEFAKTDPTSIFLQIVAIIPAHILTDDPTCVAGGDRERESSRFARLLGWERGGFRWWHYCIVLGGFFCCCGRCRLIFPRKGERSRSHVAKLAFCGLYRGLRRDIYGPVCRRGRLSRRSLFGLSTHARCSGRIYLRYASFRRRPCAAILSELFDDLSCLALLSVTLTSIRVKTNNLLPCIILHTLFNGIQSVFLILEPITKTSEVPDPVAALIYLLK